MEWRKIHWKRLINTNAGRKSVGGTECGKIPWRKLVGAISNRLGKHLKSMPEITNKKGRREIEIKIKPSVTLSGLLDVIKRSYNHAEQTLKPARIKIVINAGQKALDLAIPVATRGIDDNGKPRYPYFGLLKKALYIAPGYPRETSPNMREIVGQLVAANAVSIPINNENVLKHSYSDVDIQMTRGGDKHVKYVSDIDNIHITETKFGRWKTYTISPIEVITRLDKLEHKIKGWEYLIQTFKNFAENEGAGIEVKPVVVHIETDNVKSKDADVEKILKKKFKDYKVIRLKSATWVNNDGSRRGQEMRHVEYMGGALRNIAKLPKKYHSDITSAIISNYSDLGRLKELFGEAAALRKIWLARRIPVNVKHTLTNKYVKLLRRKERGAPLLKAIRAAKHYAGDIGENLEGMIKDEYKSVMGEKEYDRKIGRGARAV